MNAIRVLGLFVFLSSLLFSANAQAGFVAATSHGKASGCSSGAFFDPRNGGECWSCPSGYNRTLHAVTDSKACSDLIQSKASYEGKSGCPKGSFFDPRKGGECWKCPSNRPRRTAYAVTDSKACATKNIIGEKLSKATFVRKRGCDGGEFFDPRKGGECWKCPSGYNRTVKAVTDSNACSKESLKSASFKNKFACPSGQFLDLRNGGECWSCPSAKKYRTVNPVTSNKACTEKLVEIFAVDGKAMCKSIVGALGEGKKGAERLSRQLDAMISPVMKPIENEASKLAGKIRSPAELNKIYDDAAKHMSPELASEIARFQSELKKAGGKLDKVLLDPQLMCEGTPAQIDKRLSDLGLKPNLGRSKSGAWDDLFISSAYAYSGQGVYSSYSLSFAVPLGTAGNWNFGISLVTNFNGAGGVYFGLGQYLSTSTGPSASVGAMIFPVATLSDFDAQPIPGAQISFAAGDTVKAFNKYPMLPNSLDISFDPTFQSVPGFGLSKGIGGEGNPILDLTGSVGWSFPLTVWGR